MSYRPIDHIFLYHAYALAAGGWVKGNGTYTTLESVAPSVLSLVGGYASASVYNANYAAHGRSPFGEAGPAEFFVHVGHAYTEVRGIEDDRENPYGAYRTTVRSVLDDFRINDVVSVEHAEAVLVSTHAKPDKNGRKSEATVLIGGSNMSGLRVAGRHLGLTRHDDIDTEPTHGGLSRRIAAQNDPKSRSAAPDRWAAALCETSDLNGPRDDMPPYARDLARIRSDRHIRYSLFSKCDEVKDSKELTTYKASVEVPGFGRIFLGEVFCSHGMKQLNMLRFDLGCDNCGGYTGGGGTTNGETMP